MRYFIFFKQKNSTTTHLFLYEDAPNLKENEIDRQVVAIVDAWKHADFLFKNYILNGLDNTLYNGNDEYIELYTLYNVLTNLLRI